MRDRARQHVIRAASMLLFAAVWTVLSVVPTPAAQNGDASTAGVTSVDNPGGGHIYFGAMVGQPTPEEAMGKVMRRVTALCGDRPQLGKLLKNPSGEMLAGFFTVTGKNLDGKPMEGLALVYAPKSGTAGGAVLLDDAARFPTTVNPMFSRLKHELGATPASGATAGSKSPPSGSDVTVATPAQPLEPHVFPDGTGVIRLPAGWEVKPAHMGDVAASGPHGEKLRFGWTIPVMNARRGGMGGNFVAIPYDTDPGDVFRAVMTQEYRKARKSAPTIDVAKVQELPLGAAGKNEFLYGDLDSSDSTGKQYFVAQMISAPPQVMNAWQITLFIVVGPQQVMARDAATIAAIFPNYSRNSDQVARIANAQIQAGIAQTNQFVNTVAQDIDSSDRATAGMSNLLREQTVVVDTQTGGHATTSDDLAGMLVNANPSRFQPVSPSGYISGIDY